MIRVRNLLLAASVALLSACDGSDDPPALTCADWGYENDNGPAEWADLCSATCAGLKQSPIDIVTAAVVDEDLPEIALDYHETELDLFNNGHTIEAGDEGAQKTNSLEIDGKQYELLQFHFHARSEHTIDGAHSPIEMHLVHQFSDQDLVVLGVMIEPGSENTTLGPVWATLPAEESAPHRDVDVDLAELLPEAFEYYRYDGSLTTPNGGNPPASCGEIVTWLVVKEPLQMSPGQIADFQEIFDENYRPTQPLNGRVVEG